MTEILHAIKRVESVNADLVSRVAMIEQRGPVDNPHHLSQLPTTSSRAAMPTQDSGQQSRSDVHSNQNSVANVPPQRSTGVSAIPYYGLLHGKPAAQHASRPSEENLYSQDSRTSQPQYVIVLSHCSRSLASRRWMCHKVRFSRRGRAASVASKA